MARPRSRQLALDLRTWGGKRQGAGRPPNAGRAGVPHLRRAPVASRHAVHVTHRMRDHVFNLRSRRCFRPIERAFFRARERFGVRLTHFSVQGNHLHVLAEAKDQRALARAMQGLAVRIARGLNKVMKRDGPVFADRYHARALKTPWEMRRALVYVLNNARKHRAQRGAVLDADWIDPYSSGPYFEGWRRCGVAGRGPPSRAPDERPVTPARTWLLRVGWRRHGLLDPAEMPATKKGRRRGARSG